MLNLAKYATIAALAGGLGVAVSEPASAWGYGYYGCGDSCGYGYGAFGPYAYGFAYPYYGYYGYRPFYRHHYYGFYDPGRLGLVAILPLERALWRSRRSFPPIEASENRSYRKQRARRRVEAGPPRCQDGRRGEEGRRDNGARGSIAHGVAAQAGKAKDPRRRRARVRRQGARCREDGPGQGAGRGPEAEGSPKAAEAGTHFDAAKTEATSKLAAAAAAKDAAKAAETKKADAAKAANEAKLALEPVSVYISRATQKLYVRRNTHKPLPDGGEVFDATIEVPVTIRNPNKPIGTHVFTAAARNGAGLRWTGHDRQRGRRQGRARPHHHPAECARSHRADRIAAILDHRLGRASEQRDQLSHRVRRGAEQPAPGRLCDAPAERQCPRRRWLRLLFPTQLGLPIWQYAAARRPGLVVRRGTPRVGRMGAQGHFASFSLRARRVRLSSETHRESRRDGPAALGPVRNIRASILRHQLNCGVSASLYDAITDVVDAS